jgi:hypothetical protein
MKVTLTVLPIFNNKINAYLCRSFDLNSTFKLLAVYFNNLKIINSGTGMPK